MVHHENVQDSVRQLEKIYYPYNNSKKKEIKISEDRLVEIRRIVEAARGMSDPQERAHLLTRKFQQDVKRLENSVRMRWTLKPYNPSISETLKP